MKVPAPITEAIAAPGPNARELLGAVPCGRCGHLRRSHGRDLCHVVSDSDAECPCAGFKTREETLPERLIADVSAGIRVLWRNHEAITEREIEERARNIVTGLLGNYRIEDRT